MNQQLFFNILTFDWPNEPVTFHFYDESVQGSIKLHNSLWPKDIEAIFPDRILDKEKAIYTTFTREKEGAKVLSIDFKQDNPDLVKRFYNREIFHYFQHILKKRVRTGFVGENQVWMFEKQLHETGYAVFNKFTLKVQFAQVSEFPELVISSDGKSRILKKSVAQLMPAVSSKNFGLLRYKERFIKWKETPDIEDFNSDNAYPILNRDLIDALGIELETKKIKNRYRKYLSSIEYFAGKFLHTPSFKEFIPINSPAFIDVDAERIGSCPPDSNLLRFGQKQFSDDTKRALNTLMPYKSSTFSNVHMFFIYHEDDIDYKERLLEQFDTGLKFFKGLKSYVNIDFYADELSDIIYTDKANPFPEIEKILQQRIPDNDIKYIAIYLTPISKSIKDRAKNLVYYRVKELLLNHRITSQVIDPAKMDEVGNNWMYSLPNLEIAILAKLEGMPWALAQETKNELVVGIGAWRSREDDVQYIGSAFSFSNNRKFKHFEYFLKSEVKLLAGSIADKVADYAALYDRPERIIIHFYKTMNTNEMDAIIKELEKLGGAYTIFIVSINKTEAEDIVAFDEKSEDRMPIGGTYIRIGESKYLLFNNNRREGAKVSVFDGFPFPVKMKIQCTDPERLKDSAEIKELIVQVYQFSRLYFKSVSQQNLPVTIKYPEMVAEIAPHFLDPDIPDYGKDKLWFL